MDWEEIYKNLSFNAERLEADLLALKTALNQDSVLHQYNGFVHAAESHLGQVKSALMDVRKNLDEEMEWYLFNEKLGPNE